VSESLPQLRAQLSRYVARERRLLLLRAALTGLATACTSASILLLAVNLGWVRPQAVALWLGVPALLTLAVSVWPLRGWRQAADLRRQAGAAESHLPQLQGSLLTVLDRWDRAASPGLLQLAAELARAEVAKLPPAHLWPSTVLKPLRNLLFLSMCLLVLLSFLLPAGPAEAIARLFATPQQKTKLQSNTSGPRVLVGDISLRYLYPTYTGLPALEVTNSNGEVHAPPGTRVELRARSADRFDQAALQLDESPPIPAELVDGRQVSGSFDVQNNGVWRILFDDQRSPDYRIVVEPDLPPDVVVQTNGQRYSLSSDRPISLPWRARDDYGLERVVVQIREKGKPARENLVTTPVGHPRELGEGLKLTPADLGLAPGSSATLRVGAWDNDAVSGSKAGWSAPIEIEVLGPNGTAPQLAKWREALRDALVDALAPFLLDPSPPIQAAMEADPWSTEARSRYKEVDLLLSQRSNGPDAKLLKDLNERRSAFFGFLSSLERSVGVALPPKDQAELVHLQTEHVAGLEDTILYLDLLVQAEAMRGLMELLEQLRTEADELNTEAADLSAAGLQARMAQLERLLDAVQERAPKLQDKEAKDFLESRIQQVRNRMTQTQRSSAAGDMEGAREKMGQVASEIQDMVQGFEELQRRGKSRSSEVSNAMQGLREELEKLAGEQADLKNRTEQARRRFGSDMDQAIKQWQDLESQADKLALRAMQLSEENSQSVSAGALDAARQDTRGLSDSVRARNLDVALQRAMDAESSLQAAENRAKMAERFGENSTALRQQLSSARQQATRLRQQLEQLAEQRSATSPELQQALQQLAGEQQQLSDKIGQAGQRAEQVGQQLPVRSPGLKEGMEQATEQSKRAGEAMEAGDPTGAQGGQQATQDGLEQAQQALKDAQERMRQLQQASSGSQPGDEQEGEGKGEAGEGENTEGAQLELPTPEQFTTPEEYRRALLEGMEGEVPEEYRSMNRRYYEELVRQ
jgi:predicted  nucleic acid-binding Zn-ribbon protein